MFEFADLTISKPKWQLGHVDFLVGIVFIIEMTSHIIN